MEEKPTRQLKNKKVIQLFSKLCLVKMSQWINKDLTWSLWSFILSSKGNKGVRKRIAKVSVYFSQPMDSTNYVTMKQFRAAGHKTDNISSCPNGLCEVLCTHFSQFIDTTMHLFLLLELFWNKQLASAKE